MECICSTFAVWKKNANGDMQITPTILPGRSTWEAYMERFAVQAKNANDAPSMCLQHIEKAWYTF